VPKASVRSLNTVRRFSPRIAIVTLGLALGAVQLWAGAGCYSAEFIPSPTYQEYRGKSEEPEIMYHAPTRPFEVLGLLKIRDSMNPMDSGVAEFAKRQCRKIGADGAWILLKRETIETRRDLYIIIPYAPDIKTSTIGIVFAIPFAYKEPVLPK
jgi:hypothetical protein